LKLDIAWLKNKIAANQPELVPKTRTMTDLIDMTVRSVQRISSQLRPGVLDHLGLPEAIQWETQEFRERTGIECEAALDETISFDRDCSLAVFRILQETLTNVSRHSGARRVEITLRASGDTLELEVRDDGRGITAEEIESPSAFGLMGIRERALFLGGTATITGERGRGTTVTVRVPLQCHAGAR
jgi:signal transduction histidine kinase